MRLCNPKAKAAAAHAQGVSMSDTWQRFFSISSSATSPWVILKALPAIGPKIDLQQHPRLQHELRLHSFFYRVFKPLLV